MGAPLRLTVHGRGHSAVIHTGDPVLAEQYGTRMKTVRIIVNAPSSQGAIGGIYNSLLPSLTLGCGSWGSTSVSNNVSAAHLLNIKRLSTRHNNLQWFKIPPKIYFEPQAIRYLADMPDIHRVTVVTDATMTRLGFSVYANDCTDGPALHATRLVFDNLEAAVDDRAARPDAREKMHNAATIAGMAFGNAFLGIVHAMSHTLGATFHRAHGRTNAVLLPHVIRYNGTVPAKLTGWPKYEHYRAPERFQDIARSLGLPATTPAQGVESLASAVERLRHAVGIEAAFRALGVDEDAFLKALPQQALNAYDDQCAPATPRMPLLDDMQQLMRTAYYGTVTS